MLDAGTGSGILALAGRRFGAGDVIAIDNDPLAIKTAKWNSRQNGIRGVKFLVGDVREISAEGYDIITANLYSELLRETLPRFRRSLRADGRLILSGVLRAQEPGLVRALHRDGFQVCETRRRGKWIALVAAPRLETAKPKSRRS
jgi:ribosomal protein L11 methyltransferase